jgi:hypothetical protein
MSDSKTHGQVLFEELERLDPTEEGDNGWEGLSEWHKDLYCFAARAVLGNARRLITLPAGAIYREDGKIFKLTNPAMCQTCKFWIHREHNAHLEEGNNQRECTSPKIGEGEQTRGDDEMSYSYEECGRFMTGPKFGCVHHERKEQL